MSINTNYSELEVCEYMVNSLSDHRLKELILSNNSLRIKYGAFDKKNFKYNRDKGITAILALAKSNKSLREIIIGIWEAKAKLVYNEERNFESIEEAKRFIKVTPCVEDMFLLVVALWLKSSSELNAYGDEIFKDCMENKYVSEKELKSRKMSDNNKLLSMNLADCIEAISNHESIINEYEEKLKAKDELIKQLKEQLKANDIKEIKKEVVKLGKIILKNGSELQDFNSQTTTVVDSLKVDFTNVKKEVNKQSVNIDSNNKLLLNEISKIVTDIKNTITSSIIDDNRKLAKELNESINTKLDSINEIKLTKENEIETEKKLESKANEVKNSTNSTVQKPKLEDFSGFDDIFNGLLE